MGVGARGRGLMRRLRRWLMGCYPVGRSIASGGDPKGCRGRAESPLLTSIGNNFAVRNSPLMGIDAPTPARVDGAAAPTGDSTFFRRERKYQRKHAARRLREKALYCPFWRRGSLCRAQRSWPATPAIVRARSSPFSAVKMGGPFSLRCLSPLCFPAVGGGQAYPLQGFCFHRSGW